MKETRRTFLVSILFGCLFVGLCEVCVAFLLLLKVV